MNEVDLRTLELLLEEFEQSGVHLPDKEVSECKEIDRHSLVAYNRNHDTSLLSEECLSDHKCAFQRGEFVKISGDIFDAGVQFESGCDRSVEVRFD